MTATRLLHPARRLMSATTVAVVAAACVVSSHAGVADPATSEVTMAATQGRSAGTGAEASIELVAASGSPSMSARSYESQVIQRINAVRAGRDLRRLTSASCPDRAANRWSSRMASTGEFRHQSMRRLRASCDASYAGETLGRGRVSPRTLVSLWMRSTSHRRILLSSSRRIGVGARTNARGEWLVTADLIRP